MTLCSTEQIRRAQFICERKTRICSRFDDDSSWRGKKRAYRLSGSESLSSLRARTKACREKSSRLRAECNFSGIVNRYLYHSTPTRRRTILERSAYQLAWKLGLTLSRARAAPFMTRHTVASALPARCRFHVMYSSTRSNCSLRTRPKAT